jgi:hypothetical protein
MWGKPPPVVPVVAVRADLQLSGPRLKQSLEALIAGCDDVGGVEQQVLAIAAKAALFQNLLRPDGGRAVTVAGLRDLCGVIAPVRRRIGPWLEADSFAGLRDAVAALLDGADAAQDADRRVAAFCQRFPTDSKHRWVRDLAAEILHFTWPERYPLMARWIWDQAANTGVLREIWHADDVDHIRIGAPDDFATFATLRDELAGFLDANGVFRDVPFYVDALCAQIYAEYISAQGGSYLRTDFAGEDDVIKYTRRMLGIDGIDPATGRTRLKLGDGTPHRVGAGRPIQ